MFIHPGKSEKRQISTFVTIDLNLHERKYVTIKEFYHSVFNIILVTYSFKT